MHQIPFYYVVCASAGGALALGAVLNLLLLYVIRRHTSPELRIFSGLLVQTVVVDLLLVAVTFLVMPISFQDAEVATSMTLGPLGAILPFPWNTATYTLWCVLTGISTLQYGPQFFYRYCLICRRWHMPKLLFWALLLGLTVSGPWFEFALYMTTVDQPLVLREPEIAIAFGMPLPGSAEFAARTPVTNRLAYHIYIGSIPVIQALVYAVVIVCALRIRRFVNRHFKGPNEAKRRDVNRQMNTNMLIQGLLPIVLSYGPLLISISALWMQPVTGVAPGAINALLTAGSMLVMYWQPVLNPVITFATIAPYRRALLRLVWCRCLSSTPITATNEIVLTTPIVLSPAIQSSSPITTGPRGGSSFLQQQRRSPGRAPYNKQFADNLFTITNNNNNNDGRNNRHTTRNFQTTNNTTLLAFSSTPTLVQQMGIDIDTATRRTAYMSRF